MAQQRESFLLNSSQQFSLATGAENRTDLTLSPNPDLRTSIITGNVLTGSTPVVNALVKVLTPAGDPVDHQFTNAEGNYMTNPLPTGVYQIVAAAPGFLTSAPATVNLPAVTGSFVNFTLTTDPRGSKNTLYGLVLDQVTGKRIAGASVVLADAQGEVAATTLTDNEGEYILCETADGSYTIAAEKSGYALPAPLPVTVAGGQLAQTNISLSPQVVTESTVQGFIRDPAGNPLAGACVGLYAVADSAETLVRITFTNNEGFYLFGGVAAGNYVVKAKQATVI
ncbi:MAG TPA: carboxypeptidase-like regulatory domain-containing protein [Bacillota bacterium]|nr:carboxypeptidase-like regulatory domain-containing protein [Bacillota bacterium]